MANAKAQILRELSDAELFERLDQSKQELFNLRFQHVTGQLENYNRLGQLRRDVARINTEIRMREITAAETLAAEQENQ